MNKHKEIKIIKTGTACDPVFSLCSSKLFAMAFHLLQSCSSVVAESMRIPIKLTAFSCFHGYRFSLSLAVFWTIQQHFEFSEASEMIQMR